MGALSGKKILLLGLLLVLLAGIPLTVYFAQKSQETRSRAVAATKLFFANTGQTTAVTTAAQKTVNDTVSFDLVMDPGSNRVSFVKLLITYDPTKLATTDAGLVANTNVFPTTLEGPTYTSGKITMTLSVGADSTKVVEAASKIATLNLKAIASTGGSPTQVIFGNQTQVLSIATADQPSENVLASSTPASVIITEGANVTPTTTPAPTTSATPTPSPTTTANSSPTCVSLTSDGTSGTAPFTVNFTATGSDSGGTISKVTFNFGDGPVLDVTQAGGIGTNTVSVITSHTYTVPGTFQATTLLTDNNSAVSSAGNCTKTITVAAAVASSGTPSATPVPTTGQIAPPTPTIAATGPGDSVLQFGAVATVVSIVGALLFFAL